MIARRNYYQDPPVVQTPLDDVWAVVVPKARTNEISNPSLETATTGYTAGAGSLARSTAQQYHGAYSGAYTPSAATTDGFYYTFTSTVALRAVSCKFFGQKGVPYALAYASTAPAELVTYTFTATGRWQWIWLYMNDTSATSRRIYFRKNGSTSVATFYVDGVQSEVLVDASETVSTYIDGDQMGLVPNQQPPAYLWNGTPHASTSVRSGLTRAGGEVVKFRDFGFTLMAIIGLGLAAPQNVATEYARLDGGYDDYTRKPTRQFTLNGRFDGRTYAELRANRGGLARLFDRDLNAQDQRLLLLHNLEDPCGNVTTNTSRIYCKYQGGLDGNTEGQVASQSPITFIQYLPDVLADGEDGSSLSVQLSVSNANFILYRSPSGVWQAMGTGLAGATSGPGKIVKDNNGNVYVAGDFTSAGGVANTNGIARWDGSSWNTVGNGVTGGSVNALALDSQGRLYAGGSFTAAGGVADTARIARWTGAAWESVATAGANGTVNDIVVSPDGTVYAGGAFTTIGGTAASRIASYNGSAWSALSTGGAGGDVISLVADPASDIYAAGNFTSMGGIANTLRIAKWDGSAWTALGTGLGGTVAGALSIDARGILYTGGDITSAGGVSVNYLAQWNGVAWSPVGSGVAAAGSPQVSSTSAAADGGIYLSGIFTEAGDVTGLDSMAIWNGATFVPLDVDLPGGAGPLVGVIRRVDDGGIYVGFNQSGTATGAVTTTITNTGTARAYPTLVINGPSSGTARIYQIKNNTTGRAIYLNNYIMQIGEVATLSFQPDALSFVSTFQGNIAGQVLPGSNAADFFLQPGTNSITFLAGASTVTARLYWRPNYTGLDDAP